MSQHLFHYGKDFLTVSTVLGLARGAKRGILHPETEQRVQKSSDIVADIVASEEVVYGINTGFGPLCNTIISKENTEILQENILRSHAVGVGNYISKELAKIMLILKAHSLAQGHSGVSLSLLQRIIWHIENDVIPCVPEQGSVGASGDLAPLAHLFLPLIGLGQVWIADSTADPATVFANHKLEPLSLGPKEGLALINGTQFIAAHATLVVERLYNCLDHADLIGAMMIESLMGSIKPFLKQLHQVRPFTSNLHVAQRIRILLEGSEILHSHESCDRVQDPYSLRCIPQVHGTSRTAWLHLKELVETELNSVTDNPIIINEELTISGGNFHGQPLALPLDYAALAASELGNISDRRIYLALEGLEGLPKLLMKDTGINSGFMLCQYTSAALASENKSLVYPASADSIPTSLGQEDHVSMGSISGRKALKIIENLEKILAIELLCAAQAFDFRRPMKSGEVLEAIHATIRKHIDHAVEDRVFSADINHALAIITSRELTNMVSIDNFPQFKTEYHDLYEIY